MKAKKTIAAIAALMLAVSSVSSLPFAVSANADDVPAAAESANTETTDVPANDENADVSVPEDNMAVNPLADTGVAVQTETATVITAEEYADLTDEEKAEYAYVIADGVSITYEENGPEQQGTGISSGSYVKKGTSIFFGMDAYAFNGHILNLWRRDNEDTLGVDTEYFYSEGTGRGWIYSYTITANDSELSAIAMDGDYSLSVSPQEYNGFSAAEKNYYAAVNVQSPAYIWVGPNDTGFVFNGVGYVLKGNLWIAMLTKDYVNNDFLINGQLANPICVGDNYGVSYLIYPGESELNVTSQPTASAKSTINIERGTGIVVSYYVNEYDNGTQIKDGDNVRVGTPLLISCYKNLIAGHDIVVNGEVLPLHLNGDSTYMLNGYTPDSAEIVIRRVKRDELTEYEKANYVPVYFGSAIDVVEFPFSSGDSMNEFNITYESGDIIEKGSTLRIAVAPSDYAGKVLKINGTTVSMVINGDSSAYLADYVIPNNAASLNISLEDAPVIPSTPSTPSTAPVVTSPTAPSTPAPSESAAAAPSAKSVANDLKTSGKSSISYNATEAGVTKDILTAFAKNKSAKTMTAKFDNFKVKIKKSDIEDAKALEGIDFSVKEKDFISKSQIKKTNALKNSKKVVQLNFESNADVSGLKKVNIQAKAGKGFTDNTAVVYELKGSKLVKVGTAKVDLNGYVSFNTDHLGQFVVAVK